MFQLHFFFTSNNLFAKLHASINNKIFQNRSTIIMYDSNKYSNIYSIQIKNIHTYNLKKKSSQWRWVTDFMNHCSSKDTEKLSSIPPSNLPINKYVNGSGYFKCRSLCDHSWLIHANLVSTTFFSWECLWNKVLLLFCLKMYVNQLV
jgi:hypothetical protein